MPTLFSSVCEIVCAHQWCVGCAVQYRPSPRGMRTLQHGTVWKEGNNMSSRVGQMLHVAVYGEGWRTVYLLYGTTAVYVQSSPALSSVCTSLMFVRRKEIV